MTHTDLDGICCAALFLRKFGSDIEIKFVSVKVAKELSNANFSVDYTCDLPKIGTSINIDHHKSNYEDLRETNRLSEKDLVDPNAASATELVFTFLQYESDSIADEIKLLGHLADIAQLPPEYTSLDIVLSMNNDNSEFLRDISEMLAKKGHEILTTQWLQEKFREVRATYNKARKKIEIFLANTPTLPRILIFDARQGIPSKLVKEVFKPLFERKVAVIALIYSKSPQDPIRVSFRVTKAEQSYYDVSIVAKAFGGGGHRMAAACSPKSEEIPEILMQELKKIVKPDDTIQYIHMINTS
ncbi:MAG: DHHA1 domain-containing protein [Candidatus Hodarchaeales archaeon]